MCSIPSRSWWSGRAYNLKSSCDTIAHNCADQKLCRQKVGFIFSHKIAKGVETISEWELDSFVGIHIRKCQSIKQLLRSLPIAEFSLNGL